MQNLGSVCAVKSGDNRNAQLDQSWSNRCGSAGYISFEDEISYLAWYSSYHGDHNFRQAGMILASPTATDFWPPVLIPHHNMEHQNRSKNYFQRWNTLYPAMHIQSGFGNHVIFYQAFLNTIRIHSQGFRRHKNTITTSLHGLSPTRKSRTALAHPTHLKAKQRHLLWFWFQHTLHRSRIRLELKLSDVLQGFEVGNRGKMSHEKRRNISFKNPCFSCEFSQNLTFLGS